MELKHINREISQLATMEATNYISEHGLEKLKEFRYLKGLHEEKVKKLNIPNVSQHRELLLAFFDELDELPMGLGHYDREKVVENFIANNCG